MAIKIMKKTNSQESEKSASKDKKKKNKKKKENLPKKLPEKSISNNDGDDKKKEKEKLLSSLSFQIKDLHKKALLSLWHFHQINVLMTYEDLSLAIGSGEKTKSWQSGAWKDLKKGGYIVPGSEKKTFGLSDKGIALAEALASEEELAEYRTPATNERLHEKIRKRLAKDLQPNGMKHYGKEIFDLLLEAYNANRSHNNSEDSEDSDGEPSSFLRFELAAKLHTNPESHGFFYGFKASQKMGLVCETGKVTKEEYLARAEESAKERSTKKATKGKRKKTKEGETKDPKTEETEDDQDNVESETPKKKPRIRGGLQLYQLSKEKAFLVTAKSE